MTFSQFCMKVGPPTLQMALISLPFLPMQSVGSSSRKANFFSEILLCCFYSECAGLCRWHSAGYQPRVRGGKAGNLCGLARFFGLGPLFCGLVMKLTAWLYKRSARQVRR